MSWTAISSHTSSVSVHALPESKYWTNETVKLSSQPTVPPCTGVLVWWFVTIVFRCGTGLRVHLLQEDCKTWMGLETHHASFSFQSLSCHFHWLRNLFFNQSQNRSIDVIHTEITHTSVVPDGTVSLAARRTR